MNYIKSAFQAAKNYFTTWRRLPFKRAIVRAYSDGVINSYQMHELAARFDQLPKEERNKPKGGYPTPLSIERLTVALAVVLCALSLPALAQTPEDTTNNLPFGTTNITVGGITLSNVPTVDIPKSTDSLLTTVKGFFTTFTGLQTFQTNDALDVWTAAEQVGGNNTAAALGLSYTPKFSNFGNIRLGVESETRAAGIGGTILSQSGGINAQYIYKDVKLIGFAQAGYEFDLNKPAFEIGVRVWKALTDKTFSGPTISWRSGTPNHATTIGWCIGGTF